MNFSEKDVWREKTKLPNFKLSKLAKAKVLFKLEFDTEDQVLLFTVLTYRKRLDRFELKFVLTHMFSYFCSNQGKY